MLWNWIKVSKSFLDKVDILLVVLDATSNNEALSWGDVIHNKLLKKSSIDVVDVLGHTKTRHSDRVVTIGSSKQKLLILGEWIILAQVVEKIVRFLVL